MDLSRRKFLQGTATGAAGTALAGGVLIGGARADANAATQGTQVTEETSYPFHGAHQSGILTPGPSGKQAATCVAAFDVTADAKAALAELFQTITTGRGSSPPAARRPTSASASRRRTATCSVPWCPPTG